MTEATQPRSSQDAAQILAKLIKKISELAPKSPGQPCHLLCSDEDYKTWAIQGLAIGDHELAGSGNLDGAQVLNNYSASFKSLATLEFAGTKVGGNLAEM